MNASPISHFLRDSQNNVPNQNVIITYKCVFKSELLIYIFNKQKKITKMTFVSKLKFSTVSSDHFVNLKQRGSEEKQNERQCRKREETTM